MEVIVAYDIATDSDAGRRRLRRVADVCEGFGQRVQKSLFECSISDGELELLVNRLTEEISSEEDSVRLYRLRWRADDGPVVLGRGVAYDLHDPLIL
jgi:CRISPR-associated protein Cas2